MPRIAELVINREIAPPPPTLAQRSAFVADLYADCTLVNCPDLECGAKVAESCVTRLPSRTIDRAHIPHVGRIVRWLDSRKRGESGRWQGGGWGAVIARK